MAGNYTSIFMRKTFDIASAAGISALRMEAKYDDGFVLWINGHWVLSQAVDSSDPLYTDHAIGSARESNNYDPFLLPASALSYLHDGTNVIAVQAFNISKSGSSDCFFDARLIATHAEGPTPGGRNAVYATNAPPLMRQLEQNLEAPTSGTPVTISMKATDSDGVASMVLNYQLVDPGNYIAVDEAAYSSPANWQSLPMHDDGLNGDAVAGDNVYTVVMPAGLQTNRRLIRYTITATDGVGLAVTAPYADDTQPNFAYYVYDGIPAWQGAIQPGSSNPTYAQVNTFSPALMNSIASLQLLTTRQSHVDSQYLPGTTRGSGYTGDLYLWSGTLVYNGQVYDNIHYRARGGVWRYAMGKNMWKFDLNTGHDMQMYDEYGRPYPVKFSKINLGANIQQGNFGQRGEQGLFEHVGFEAFNLANTPGSLTSPMQLRIVENASETGPTSSQYDDDFQGMYLLVEQDDGRFLDSHDLPDGNLYRMEGGTGAGGGSLNNQGPTQPADNSDLVSFVNTLSNSSTTDQWIRDNVDLNSYYSYRAIVELIHHWDIGFGKNYYYYHNPVTNKWTQIPWDLDLTWTTTYEPGGGDNEPFKAAILSRPVFLEEYRNRAREIRDLLWNPEQMGKLLDDYASLVDTTIDGQSMVEADRAMWDFNPIMASSYVNSDKAGQGRFYQNSSGSFAGFVTKLKAYVSSRASYFDSNVITSSDDQAAPARPSAYYTGPTNYPVNQLTFRSSNFVAGNLGGSFAAMQWRLADISPTAPGTPPNYEINAAWTSDEITPFNNTIQVPAGAVQPGHVYRVRVRFKDSNGRWSHWSNVTIGSAGSEFTATASTSDIVQSLRITEINYNPRGNGDEEFIELKNTGSSAINLAGVQFTTGIVATLDPIDLMPGESCVVVKDRATFEAKYPHLNLKIAGQYGPDTSLSNAGEQIVLADATGVVIQDFTYSDAWYPTTDGDGQTLVINDPTQPVSTWNDLASWHASLYKGGTPGADENTTPDGALVVNEVLAHTDASVTGDWVEFHNTSAGPITLTNWFLSDDPADPQKFQIPATTIPAGGYVVFNQFTQFDLPGGPGVITPFSFSEFGDSVVLSSANAFGVLSGYQVEQSFGASQREVSIGRIPTSAGYDFGFLITPTKGTANAAPMIGPVVINELLYNPVSPTPEYVELHNISSDFTPLYDPENPTHVWQFTQGLTYAFPQGIVLSPDEYVLVVPTDEATFRASHPEVPASVRIFGPFTGALDNSGETIAIAQPADPELDGSYAYYTVDSVKYSPAAPWPVVTATPIAKTASTAYSDDPANWAPEITAYGSPGRPNFSLLVGDTPYTDWTLRLNGSNFEIYNSYPASGSPFYSAPLVSVPAFTVLGKAAFNGLYVDTTQGNPIPAGGLSTSGLSSGLTVIGSNDSLTLESGAIGMGTLSFPAGQTLSYVYSAPLSLQGISSLNVNLTSASNQARILKSGADLLLSIDPAPGSNYPVRLNALQSLALSAPDGANTLDVRAGSFQLNTSGHFAISVSGTASLTLSAPQRLAGLSLQDSAKVDLLDNDLIVDYASPSPLESIRQWIHNGTLGAGAQLLTSISEAAPGHPAALAPFDNALLHLTEWDGAPLAAAPDFSQVVIKHTYAGDANLDGMVDSRDFTTAIANMGRTGASWLFGDVNSDGAVTADDFAVITANLGAGSGGEAGPLLLTAPVPLLQAAAPAPAVSSTDASPDTTPTTSDAAEKAAEARRARARKLAALHRRRIQRLRLLQKLRHLKHR